MKITAIKRDAELWSVDLRSFHVGSIRVTSVGVDSFFAYDEEGDLVRFFRDSAVFESERDALGYLHEILSRHYLTSRTAAHGFAEKMLLAEERIHALGKCGRPRCALCYPDDYLTGRR